MDDMISLKDVKNFREKRQRLRDLVEQVNTFGDIFKNGRQSKFKQVLVGPPSKNDFDITMHQDFIQMYNDADNLGDQEYLLRAISNVDINSLQSSVMEGFKLSSASNKKAKKGVTQFIEIVNDHKNFKNGKFLGAGSELITDLIKDVEEMDVESVEPSKQLTNLLKKAKEYGGARFDSLRKLEKRAKLSNDVQKKEKIKEYKEYELRILREKLEKQKSKKKTITNKEKVIEDQQEEQEQLRAEIEQENKIQTVKAEINTEYVENQIKSKTQIAEKDKEKRQQKVNKKNGLNDISGTASGDNKIEYQTNTQTATQVQDSLETINEDLGPSTTSGVKGERIFTTVDETNINIIEDGKNIANSGKVNAQPSSLIPHNTRVQHGTDINMDTDAEQVRQELESIFGKEIVPPSLVGQTIDSVSRIALKSLTKHYITKGTSVIGAAGRLARHAGVRGITVDLASRADNPFVQGFLIHIANMVDDKLIDGFEYVLSSLSNIFNGEITDTINDSTYYETNNAEAITDSVNNNENLGPLLYLHIPTRGLNPGHPKFISNAVNTFHTFQAMASAKNKELIQEGGDGITSQILNDMLRERADVSDKFIPIRIYRNQLIGPNIPSDVLEPQIIELVEKHKDKINKEWKPINIDEAIKKLNVHKIEEEPHKVQFGESPFEEGLGLFTGTSFTNEDPQFEIKGTTSSETLRARTLLYNLNQIDSQLFAGEGDRLELLNKRREYARLLQDIGIDAGDEPEPQLPSDLAEKQSKALVSGQRGIRPSGTLPRSSSEFVGPIQEELPFQFEKVKLRPLKYAPTDYGDIVEMEKTEIETIDDLRTDTIKYLESFRQHTFDVKFQKDNPLHIRNQIEKAINQNVSTKSILGLPRYIDVKPDPSTIQPLNNVVYERRYNNTAINNIALVNSSSLIYDKKQQESKGNIDNYELSSINIYDKPQTYEPVFHKTQPVERFEPTRVEKNGLLDIRLIRD